MNRYGQSNKWKRSWSSFPPGMSLLHARIGADIHTVSPEMHTHACRCTAPTEMFTLQSALTVHIQADMLDSWICACWHIYIWARLSWAGPWFGVTGLMPLPSGQRRGRSHNVTGMKAESCLSFTVTLQWHNLSSSLLSSQSWPRHWRGNVSAQLAVFSGDSYLLFHFLLWLLCFIWRCRRS